MFVIPDSFKTFIDLNCDRKAFIQNFLNQSGIDAPVISLDGKNHIYVKFPLSQYNSDCRVKTVIAHYDRVSGSPGANDNSAAVFTLLLWAREVALRDFKHNIRLIFTDGEEMGAEGVNSQGAFALAELFRRLGITKDEVYVFDCMGRGDVPVICETHLPSGVDTSFLRRMNELECKVQKICVEAGGGKWFKMPVSYSDNAGFIVNGIPAVAVSLLPASEISEYVKTGKQPETWKLFHTMSDNFDSLDSSSFELFYKMINLLASQKTFL